MYLFATLSACLLHTPYFKPSRLPFDYMSRFDKIVLSMSITQASARTLCETRISLWVVSSPVRTRECLIHTLLVALAQAYDLPSYGNVGLTLCHAVRIQDH